MLPGGLSAQVQPPDRSTHHIAREYFRSTKVPVLSPYCSHALGEKSTVAVKPLLASQTLLDIRARFAASNELFQGGEDFT
jgi:hypothetical protein